MDQGVERRQEEDNAKKEDHEVSVGKEQVAEGRQEILEVAHAPTSGPTERPWKTGE
jgi:hypothetical protein